MRNFLILKVTNPEALALLEAEKQIQGSILSFSANLDAEKLNNVHLVRDFSDVIEKYSIGTALIANNDFYENEMKELFGVKIQMISLDYKNKLYRIEVETPLGPAKEEEGAKQP